MKKKFEKKNANGEGTCYKDKRGNWVRQITLGIDPMTGKVIRKTFSSKNKKEAFKKAIKYQADVINGKHVEPKKINLRDWMYEYIETFKKDKVKPKTYDWYENMIDRYFVVNTIGDIKIQKLNTMDIQKFYNKLSEEGRIDGNGGLSHRTVEGVARLLKSCLGKAVELEYLVKNPAKSCTLPKKPIKTNDFYTAEEEKKILKNLTKDNSMSYLIKLAFATGLRQGELIALEWDDIDFDKSKISVNKSVSVIRNRDERTKGRYQIIVKEPKNKSSIREVPITESIEKMLKGYKKKDNMIKRINKKSKVNKNLVFSSISGTLIHPTNLRRYWKKIVEKAGVRYLSFHNTRHCFATRLLDEGIQHKVVQELLGHSRISTTLDIYTHVDDNLKENAISKIDHIFKDE